MAQKIILIAGASASGKSRYAKHLENTINLPVLCKDTIKEVLHDGLCYDASTVEKTQFYGACAYKLLFYFAECLMKTGMDFVMESNFTNDGKEPILSLLKKYDYDSITIFFDAPLQILHQRFLNRENTEERHIGLSKGIYLDFETYRRVAEKQTTFDLGGRKLSVDVTDLSRVDYAAIDDVIRNFLTP